jgi:hypothetical protein
MRRSKKKSKIRKEIASLKTSFRLNRILAPNGWFNFVKNSPFFPVAANRYALSERLVPEFRKRSEYEMKDLCIHSTNIRYRSLVQIVDLMTHRLERSAYPSAVKKKGDPLRRPTNASSPVPSEESHGSHVTNPVMNGN